MEKVIVYTDGSSKGNPGPGGWGAVIFLGDEVIEIGGPEKETTNNRMEMEAAIRALELVARLKQKPGFEDSVEVLIHTDSEYLLKGITEWVHGWQRNGWRTKDKKAVLNQDLWEQLIALTLGIKVEWQKVLGHSGHRYNDRCDRIATHFADGKPVSLFEGKPDEYERFLGHKVAQ